MVERGDDEGVLDPPLPHQLGDFGHGHKAGDQVFAMVKFHRLDAAAVLHQHGETGVGHDGRVRKDLAENPRVLADVAGFLAQFALARGLR